MPYISIYNKLNSERPECVFLLINCARVLKGVVARLIQYIFFYVKLFVIINKKNIFKSIGSKYRSKRNLSLNLNKNAVIIF